jgi:antitoxin ParD1/3/4
MNVSLTPELENFVQTKVTSGRYTSASEVVREALRLLEEHDKARAAQLQEFRSEVDRRLASLDQGEGLDGETVFNQIRAKSEQRRRKRA